MQVTFPYKHEGYEAKLDDYTWKLSIFFKYKTFYDFYENDIIDSNSEKYI